MPSSVVSGFITRIIGPAQLFFAAFVATRRAVFVAACRAVFLSACRTALFAARPAVLVTPFFETIDLFSFVGHQISCS